MTVEYTTLISGEKQVVIRFSEDMINSSLVGLFEEAKNELVKKMWAEKADTILSKMDLTGLAHLIAAYTAKELAGKK